MAAIDVRECGAKGDGVADDHAALLKALTDADAAGGGTVLLPAGTYAVSSSLAPPDPARPFSRVHMIGDGDRAATIVATGDFAPISGHWFRSRIENLVIDAGGHGSPGLVVDLDKSYVRHCWVDNWTDYGISLNPNIVGLLNWVDDNFIEQCKGTGIYTTYRFYDSWIVNNNVGSTGANLSVESGPVRILANHLNGSPRYNIELRGNRLLTIIGNICEGARREAIIYTMPNWLELESPLVQIVGNDITNGGKEKPGRYPAIGIYARDAQHHTGGFNITGNFFGCTDDDAGWTYSVDAQNVDNLAITGNQWDDKGFSVAATRTGGKCVAVSGNTSGNTDSRIVVTLTENATLTATTGDQVCFLADGADVTLPAAAGNTCRFTIKNVSAAGRRLKAPSGESIDRRPSATLAQGESLELVSDGTNWWSI